MPAEAMTAPIDRLCDGLDAIVTPDAPIGEAHTWFKAGGRCDALVQPRSLAALRDLLRRCGEADAPVRVLGLGANLLVADEGVDGVVLKLDQPAFNDFRIGVDGCAEMVEALGGVDLAKVMHAAGRAGLEGLSPMAGIPASAGGAIRMNAGGRYGAIGDVVESVTLLDAHGRERTLQRSELRFDYRHAELPEGIVLSARFKLTPDDPARARERILEIMAYKKRTQPLKANSAGCMFRNPTLATGERVSAGMLIDRSGLKGATHGSALVSDEHANFLCVAPCGRANDVLALVETVQARVQAEQGVALNTEVVIWRRGDRAGAIR